MISTEHSDGGASGDGRHQFDRVGSLFSSSFHQKSRLYSAVIPTNLPKVGRYKLVPDLLRVVLVAGHGLALHLPGLELGADIAFN